MSNPRWPLLSLTPSIVHKRLATSVSTPTNAYLKNIRAHIAHIYRSLRCRLRALSRRTLSSAHRTSALSRVLVVAYSLDWVHCHSHSFRGHDPVVVQTAPHRSLTLEDAIILDVPSIFPLLSIPYTVYCIEARCLRTMRS